MTERALKLSQTFREQFQASPSHFIVSPGRLEIIGNHTDHQGGSVLVASIDLFMMAAVSRRGDGKVVLLSEGYPRIEIDLSDEGIRVEEYGQASALIRGVGVRLRALGYRTGGLNVVMNSDIKPGSGISSSAAFELLMANIHNHLYNDGAIDRVEMARVGQYAENHYFGKPSGLLDQIGIALGGVNYVEFADPSEPLVEAVPFPFPELAFFIVNTGGSHTDLTSHYALVKEEMRTIAAHFGRTRLIDVAPETFNREVIGLADKYGIRAVNRALHFFSECERVRLAKYALEKTDEASFLKWINASGRSSETLLENITFAGDDESKLQKGLAFCSEKVKNGAYRVHGGGFAGTILVIIPAAQAKQFMADSEAHFGHGSVWRVHVEPRGIAAYEYDALPRNV